jgi:hypothetical protein
MKIPEGHCHRMREAEKGCFGAETLPSNRGNLRKQTATVGISDPFFSRYGKTYGAYAGSANVRDEAQYFSLELLRQPLAQFFAAEPV